MQCDALIRWRLACKGRWGRCLPRPGLGVFAGEAEGVHHLRQAPRLVLEAFGGGSALVDRAGATMSEVVGAIRRVTDIVGEISAASHEQSLGVAQVGEAVTQMDQVTQQNAALVEEMAAAASSLKSQAEDLVQVVSVFQLEDEGGSHLGQASLQRTRQSLQIQ